MAWTESLNLQYWLVNTLSGSMTIFLFLSVITIAAMAAYFRMSNILTFAMLFVYLIIMNAFIGSIYLTIGLIIAGLIIFQLISRAIR